MDRNHWHQKVVTRRHLQLTQLTTTSGVASDDKVGTMTTLDSSDDKVGIMTTLGFHWRGRRWSVQRIARLNHRLKISVTRTRIEPPSVSNIVSTLQLSTTFNTTYLKRKKKQKSINERIYKKINKYGVESHWSLVTKTLKCVHIEYKLIVA